MFSFNHFNFNVTDLDRSLKFYKEALGFEPVREINGNGFKLVFLGDGKPTSGWDDVAGRPSAAV